MILTRFSKKDLKLMQETFVQLDGRILDIGCGNLLDRLGFTPGSEYIGVDIKESKYTTLIADIHNLPFKDGTFNSCICNAVLEHVLEPGIALKECSRILKDNGVLWLSVPFLQHIHSDWDYRRFTDQGLKYEINKAGFELDKLYGGYGVLDNMEYLLFNAIGWRVTKDKDYKTFGSLLYIFILGFFFVMAKTFGTFFSSQQKKDIHHATNFTMIARKVK